MLESLCFCILQPQWKTGYSGPDNKELFLACILGSQHPGIGSLPTLSVISCAYVNTTDSKALLALLFLSCDDHCRVYRHEYS